MRRRAIFERSVMINELGKNCNSEMLNTILKQLTYDLWTLIEIRRHVKNSLYFFENNS